MNTYMHLYKNAPAHACNMIIRPGKTADISRMPGELRGNAKEMLLFSMPFHESLLISSGC